MPQPKAFCNRARNSLSFSSAPALKSLIPFSALLSPSANILWTLPVPSFALPVAQTTAYTVLGAITSFWRESLSHLPSILVLTFFFNLKAIYYSQLQHWKTFQLNWFFWLIFLTFCVSKLFFRILISQTYTISSTFLNIGQ